MRFPAPAAPPRLLSMRSLIGLAVALAICFAASAVGSAFTTPALDPWYEALRKPAFTPPDAVFGPVWSVLYALMAVAAWRVWLIGRGDPRQRGALALFAVQLALNVGWSAAFFGAQSPLGGLAVITLLLAAIAATILSFLRIDRLAALLMLPYLAWVAFAAVLNGTIWWLNR